MASFEGCLLKDRFSHRFNFPMVQHFDTLSLKFKHLRNSPPFVKTENKKTNGPSSKTSDGATLAEGLQGAAGLW